MEALYIPGRSRAEATSAVLTIVPKKEDDNSSYRCTVWNRAIPETRIMEASTSIDVNCKYTNIVQTGQIYSERAKQEKETIIFAWIVNHSRP